jgi:hypothetical protein
MILIDANLLIYAYGEGNPHYDAASRWLDHQLQTVPRVGLPWPSLLAFVRLVTNPRAVTHPVPIPTAWTQVEQWLRVPAVWIPAPTERHAQVLGPLLRAHVAHANLVPDAHLAALALEHDLTLCSTDRDFARFPGLRWENPLR